MNTFEDAVRAARDAKASIESLTKAEALQREALAALRVDFAREEAALIDSVALYQKQAQEAREALQSALQQINDAPLQAPSEFANGIRPLPMEAGETVRVVNLEDISQSPGYVANSGFGATFEAARD